jgi:hypothetical protein
MLMSYLKGRNDYAVVMYCKCCWPVCTGCCSFVRHFVQLSALQDYSIPISACQVTNKDTGQPLELAYKCQNM